MAWNDRLQKASFRGVAFHVEADDGSFGRRVQVHEYPQRDKPFVEDLGRKAREFTITAFLVGPDYMEARDKLLDAVEKPGPGTLVHPWYGQLTVSLKDDGCRVSHSRDDGGLCRIQLTFIESGELTFPSASASSGSRTLQAADGMQVMTEAQFGESFVLDGYPAWVAEDAAATAADMLTQLDGALSSGVLAGPVDGLIEQINSQLAAPTGFAQQVFGLFSKASAIVSTSANFADFSSLNFMRVFSAVRAAGLFGNTARPAGLTPSRARLYDNRDALAMLMRRAALVQAAGMSAVMTMPVYDDAVQLRGDLLAALDREAALGDDATYAMVMDLRSSVHQDITARLRDSARLQVINQREVIPALALAYDLYEDTGREAEIITRNRVRHPGFIPAEPIKVLST